MDLKKVAIVLLTIKYAGILGVVSSLGSVLNALSVFPLDTSLASHLPSSIVVSQVLLTVICGFVSVASGICQDRLCPDTSDWQLIFMKDESKLNA